MPFGAIVGSIGTAIGAAEAIYKAAKVGLDFTKGVHYARVLDALKSLSFLDDGTMLLFKKLAENLPVQPVNFQRASTRYFNVGDDVYQSLQYIETHCSFNDASLSIKEANDIGRMLHLKLDVRSEIDEFMYDVEQSYGNLDNEGRVTSHGVPHAY